jgi:predicted DNA-binding protein
MSKRHERVRLHPYVEPAVAKRLAAYSAATGIPSSTVVQAALGQYLDRTSDTTLILRRLDRLGRADERMQRDLELLSEAFVVWVRVWFSHAPRITDDAKEFARRTGESRFTQFMEHVAEQFMGGHRFIDDLPREVVADDAELAHLATRVQSPESANPPTGADGE